MNTTIRAGKTISTKELSVVANFHNGFAENVLELSDGTLIYVSYSGDRVRIVERELLDDPATQVPAIVNKTPKEFECPHLGCDRETTTNRQVLVRHLTYYHGATEEQAKDIAYNQ
jgi:hypothetical protein